MKRTGKSLKILQKFSIDPRDLNMGEDEKVFDKKNKEKEKEKEKKLEFSIEEEEATSPEDQLRYAGRA